MATKKPRSPLPDGRRAVSIQETGVTMIGHTEPHPQTPAMSPYRFPKGGVKDIAVGVRLGMNMLLTGPTGCGKTSLPIQLAAYLGIPMVRFNMDGETRVSHVRGQQRPVAKDGVLTLEFSLGAFAAAMRNGYWVVLDEIDAALASVLFVLQPVLEEGLRQLIIPETGETVVAHPEFRLFATSNTVGYRAQARSRHAGTNVMNTAFVDRFGMIIACDYPPRLEEIERVRCHATRLAASAEGAMLIDGICRVAEDLRKDPKFRSDFSTRRLIQWARLIEAFPTEGWSETNPNGQLPYDLLRAAELAVVRKFESPVDAQLVRECIQRQFAYTAEEITAAARGGS